MNDSVMSNSAVSTTNYSFLVALIAAIIVHIVLALSVPVAKPELEPIGKNIDITLVNTPSPQVPAPPQENQLASSKQINKPEPVKPVEPPAPQVPPVSKVKPIPKNLTEKVKPTPQVKPVLKTPEKVKPLPKPELKPIEQPKPKLVEKPIPKPIEKIAPVIPNEQPFKADPLPVTKSVVEQKILTQANAEQKIVTQTPPTIDSSQPEKPIEPVIPKEKPVVEQKIPTQTKDEQKIVNRTHSTLNNSPHHISAASLQQQISEQAMASTQQAVDDAPKVKTKSVNQVTANKYVASQYLHDWETKVANVGNRNYPEAATKAGFSATLIMEVGINIEGDIEYMRITQSSGNPALDDAAKKIVRMSAPFPPLPLALRSELDILKITRVWKFTDESGLVTQ
jgi:protein TonB